MVDFYSLFYELESSGFYEYVLPFFLIFVVVFAILEKTRILGGTENKPKTNLNIVLSIILAMIVLFNTNLIYLMNQTLSRVSFFIIISVLIMLLIALFYNPKDGKPIGLSMGVATVLAIAGVFWSLSTSYYGYDILPYWLYLNDSTTSLIFFLVLFGVIIYFITGPHEKKDKDKFKIIEVGD
tara:strand:+ start:248 stop:793 length:546 start_codon:yes stop_codon:yes gene_type:complete